MISIAWTLVPSHGFSSSRGFVNLVPSPGLCSCMIPDTWAKLSRVIGLPTSTSYTIYSVTIDPKTLPLKDPLGHMVGKQHEPRYILNGLIL